MKRRQKEAIILALVDKLEEQGSWCGETHVQKATFFLEDLTGVPLGLDFVLYKHGPFSFDLRDEITAMRADGLIKMQPQPYPYGPSLLTTENGSKLQSRWPKTIEKYSKDIQFVAERLGTLGVSELERLATALYLTKKYPEEGVESRAQRLNKLKPHISIDEAQSAIQQIDRMVEEYEESDECQIPAPVL